MFTKLFRYQRVVCLLVTVFFFSVVRKATPIDNVEYLAGVIPIQDANQPMYDYFDAARDPAVKQALQAVERYHMTKEVLQNIGSGKYQYALGDIDFTLRYFPNHPMGLQLLTTVASLTKNRALAIRYFEKAIGLYPSHAITHAQYGWYFVTIGDVDNGIQKLKHAVEVDPKLTAGYVWLAQAYEKKGDSQLAREARERAKELGYKGTFSGDSSK
jgi:predicted Zn-dependent protease